MGHSTWDMGHVAWDMGHGTWEQGKGTGNRSNMTIETVQSAACSGQHGKQSSQQTAACFHFFIEENIGKVKSTGCLLWG